MSEINKERMINIKQREVKLKEDNEQYLFGLKMCRLSFGWAYLQGIKQTVSAVCPCLGGKNLTMKVVELHWFCIAKAWSMKEGVMHAVQALQEEQKEEALERGDSAHCDVWGRAISKFKSRAKT